MRVPGGKRVLWIVVAVFLAAGQSPLATATPVNYEMVTIGDPGNANDPATESVYGGVNYTYQIGKYDVTIGQYAAFLNAVAKSDPYSLYDSSMGTNGNIAGISQAGSSGSYSYSVIGSANRPITYVSWWDSARFANWMANGQPTGAQSSTTTENGAYNVNRATSGYALAKNSVNPNTGTAPAFLIPTESEWYKAAYYSPTLNSGAGGYYIYATQSNAVPGNQVGSAVNQANYLTSVYSVTQSSDYSASQDYLTDAGAFSGSRSFYGTFDQSGNVYQWNDQDGLPGSTRGLRGGAWDRNPYGTSSHSYSFDPSYNNYVVGFRLAGPAAVPEIDPARGGSALSLVAGVLAMIEQRRRLKAEVA